MVSFVDSKVLLSVCIVGTLCQFCLVESHETDMEKELILTYQEKVAFDKFKAQVYPSVSKLNNFLRTDLFLLRFLRSQNLDVNRAVKGMHECLEWRKRNKIDTISDEDWSDMTMDYPPPTFVTDLQGRPVAVGSIGGQWNVRRSTIQGTLHRLSRYAYKLVEDVFNRTYEINKMHPNITQFSCVVNLEGFNVFQQACPLCLSTYVQLLMAYNEFYPNFAHAIIAINTPQVFNIVLDLAKPTFSQDTRNALKVYGYNKKQWKAALDEEIDENKLTSEFGGTIPVPEDKE